MSRTPKLLTRSGIEIEHLKVYLVEMGRARCKPPNPANDRALPEFKTRWTESERITQKEFARMAGTTAGHVSSAFRNINKLGGTWTGLLDALGFDSIEAALAAARQWTAPSGAAVRIRTRGSKQLDIALGLYRRTDGPVSRKQESELFEILATRGDRSYDEWIGTIREVVKGTYRFRSGVESIRTEIAEIGDVDADTNSSATRNRRGRRPPLLPR